VIIFDRCAYVEEVPQTVEKGESNGESPALAVDGPPVEGVKKDKVHHEAKDNCENVLRVGVLCKVLVSRVCPLKEGVLQTGHVLLW
jgi:hypothetical protein